MDTPSKKPMPVSRRYNHNDSFAAAKTIEEQIKHLITLFELIEIEHDHRDVQVKAAIQYVCDQHFWAPLRHPVRDFLAKHISKLQIRHTDTLRKSYKNTVMDSCAILIHSGEIRDLEHMMNSLHGCFENCLQARQCLKNDSKTIISFIDYCMTTFLEILPRCINNPSKSREVYGFIHSLTRLALSCAFKNLITISTLIVHCRKLIVDKNASMDTRVNCGTLICIQALKSNFAYNEPDEKYPFPYGIVDEINCRETPSEEIIGLAGGLAKHLNEIYFGNCLHLITEVIESLVVAANRNSSDANVILGVCRIFGDITKTLKAFEFLSSNEDNLNSLKSGLFMCIDFVCIFCEHPMAAIWESCGMVVENLLRIGVTHMHFACLIDKIKEFAQSSDISSKTQKWVLIHLCNVLKIDRCFIGMNINIQQNFLTHYSDENLKSCYKHFMTKSFNPEEYDIWIDEWIVPLIQLSSSVDAVAIAALEELLTKAIILYPNLCHHECMKDFPFRITVHAKLMQIVKIKQNKISQDSNIKSYNIIAQCGIKNIDEEVRLKSLKILSGICQTPIISNETLDIFLIFLRLNINCIQNPDEIIKQFCKLLQRIESYCASTDATAETLKDYKEFVLKLWEVIVTSLTADANQIRVSTALKLLAQTIKSHRTVLPQNWFKTEDLLDSLLSILQNDKHTANKDLCIVILKEFPYENDVSILPKFGKNPLKKLKGYLASTSTCDTINAAYFIEYSIISKLLFKNHFEAMEFCVMFLREGLINARKSIVKASLYNPLHGSLFAVRFLFNKIDLNSVEIFLLRVLLIEIIELCLSAAEVVLPIVTNDSPEGYFPDIGSIGLNDSDDDDVVFLGEIVHKEKEFVAFPNKPFAQTQKSNSQILLGCGWRCIKESSLLLGDIARTAPFHGAGSQDTGVIQETQLKTIGDHFIKLLCETKHNGAFEQATHGFESLCKRLSQFKDPLLHDIPKEWLYKIINDISGSNKTDGLFCHTRRSAGVPHILKVIISNQLKCGLPSAYKEAMPFLLERCEDRIFALNILEKLFKCSELSDVISEHVADGIKTSIRGYGSKDFDERNASSLLLATLLIRIFGVQRTRDSENLCVRNLMTGRVFFVRYPSLFNFFLDVLNKEKSNIGAENYQSVFHPLLMILSRLYPSAMDGEDATAKLDKYIALISICSDNPNFDTRVLAAKSIAAIISPDRAFVRASTISKALPNSCSARSSNENETHASLLQLQYVLKSTPIIVKGASANFNLRLILRYLEQAFDVYDDNFTLLSTYSECLIEVLIRTDKLNPDFAQGLIKKYKAMLFNSRSNRLQGFNLMVKPAFILTMLLRIKLGEPLDDILLRNLENECIEYIEAILNFCILVIDYPHTTQFIEDEMDLSQTEVQFVTHIPKENRDALKQKLIYSNALCNNLIRIQNDDILYPNRTAKLYDVLSRLNLCNANMVQMLEVVATAPTKTDIIHSNILKYFTSAINKNRIITKVQTLFVLTHIKKLIVPTAKFELRMAAANIIAAFHSEWPTYVNELELYKQTYLPIIVNYLLITIELLRDDSSIIRNNMSDMVMKLTKFESLNERIVSTHAECLFLEFIKKQLDALHNVNDKFCVWFSLVCGMQGKRPIDVEDGESNTFAEYVSWRRSCVKQADIFLSDTTDIFQYAKTNLTADILDTDTMEKFLKVGEIMGCVPLNFKVSEL